MDSSSTTRGVQLRLTVVGLQYDRSWCLGDGETQRRMRWAGEVGYTWQRTRKAVKSRLSLQDYSRCMCCVQCSRWLPDSGHNSPPSLGCLSGTCQRRCARDAIFHSIIRDAFQLHYASNGPRARCAAIDGSFVPETKPILPIIDTRRAHSAVGLWEHFTCMPEGASRRSEGRGNINSVPVLLRLYS